MTKLCKIILLTHLLKPLSNSGRVDICTLLICPQDHRAKHVEIVQESWSNGSGACNTCNTCYALSPYQANINNCFCVCSNLVWGLGTDDASKTDEFSETYFQTAFDPPPPPPYLWKILSKFFLEMSRLKPCIKVQNLQFNFLDWNCPPHFRTFPKIYFGTIARPLLWRTLLCHVQHFACFVRLFA